MTQPDHPNYMRLRDPETVIVRTIPLSEAVYVDLTFGDQVVGIANLEGPVNEAVLRYVLLHTPWMPMPTQEITLPAGYEYCTTEGHNRRHVSRGLKPVPPNRQDMRGRTGTTLCGHDAVDQVLADWRYVGSGGRARIDDMQICGGCLRTLKRLTGGAG